MKMLVFQHPHLQKQHHLCISTPHFVSKKPQGGGTNLESCGATESVAHPNMRPQANAFA